MKPAFLAFAVTCMLLTLAAGGAGLAVEDERGFAFHFAVGLIATLGLCLCHCVVFTYFMATSKMMILAVDDAGLDPARVVEVRSLKLRAFRRAVTGIIAAMVTAFAGAYATDHAGWTRPHLAAALLSLGVQAVVFTGEYRVIAANGLLMDRIFGEHDRQSRLRGAAGAESAS